LAINVSAPFIRAPVANSLLMVAVLFIGLIAYPSLPVAPLPQVDFPTLQVSATLPGASPETMASSVAQPPETEFAQIPGVSQMTSVSSLGATAITLQFNLDRNLDGAASDVLEAIKAAQGQLPKDLPTPPTLKKVNPTDSQILLLAATSNALPLTQVDDQVSTKLMQRSARVQAWAKCPSVASRRRRSASSSTPPNWSPRTFRWKKRGPSSRTIPRVQSRPRFHLL